MDRLLDKSPLGIILQKSYDNGGQRNVVIRYLHDFICMTYKPQSKLPDLEYEVSAFV